MTFLMRFALPFARARCGAFSFAQFFLCALRYHLRKRGMAPFLMLLALPLSEVFLMRFAPPPVQATINFFPHSPSAAFLLAKIPAP